MPPYVTSRTDNPVPKPKPGTSRLLVTLYATSGSTLTSVTVDGKQQDAQPGSDARHPLFSATVEVPPQKSVTLIFTFDEPRAKGPVQTFVQPLSRPATQTIKQPSC